MIAELGEEVVAFELDHQVFHKSWPIAKQLAKEATAAIWHYRSERSVNIPYWFNELKFKREEALYLEINSLLERVNRLESPLLSWRHYESVLTLSGKRLMTQIRALLESVFDLKVKLDGNGESGVIIDGNQRPFC